MKINKEKQFIQELSKINYSKNVIEIFEDFVKFCAYTISYSTGMKSNHLVEYEKFLKKYSKEEKRLFANLIVELVKEYSKEDPEDILGNVFECLGISNKQRGQFFTPKEVCRVMGDISIDKESAEKFINKHGYVSINDPTCGSGRTLLYTLLKLKNLGVDLNKVYVEGDDISQLCACITYINLSLIGASGIVKHQDTLTLEVYDTFYTPNLLANKELLDCLVRDGYLIKKENIKDDIQQVIPCSEEKDYVDSY